MTHTTVIITIALINLAVTIVILLLERRRQSGPVPPAWSDEVRLPRDGDIRKDEQHGKG